MNDMIEVKYFDVLAGANINEVAEEASLLAKKHDCIVIFNFNSVELKVYKFMNSEEIVKEYYKELNKK